MKVLVVNAGSSSLKYQLFNTESRDVLAKGICERIGIDGRIEHRLGANGEKHKRDIAMPNHAVAMKIVVDTLSCDEDKVTMEASLTEDLEADSLDAVELNMALEDACGVSIPDEELAKLKTVGDIYNYITAHI